MNTRRIFKAMFGLVFATALIASSLHAQLSEAEKLYEAGIYQLEAVGNFDQAITIFNRVAKEFATNKPISAKALVKLGLCYERLGSQKAQEAYQRVIRDYGDQREAAAEARTLLSRKLA